MIVLKDQILTRFDFLLKEFRTHSLLGVFNISAIYLDFYCILFFVLILFLADLNMRWSDFCK